MGKDSLNEWVELPIENILAPNAKGIIISQGWSPQCEKEPSTSEKDWGVLKTTAIQNGFFLEEENKKLPAYLEPKPQHEVKEGDILITCAGPRNRCGIPCLVRKTRKKLMTSGKMYRFRINEEFAIPEFVEAYLLSQKAWKEIDKMKTGISDSGLNLTHSRFKKLLIPIPRVTTQQAIVSKIEELFSELDKGIENLRTAHQQLKTYRQAVLKWAFEGKLTKEWRKAKHIITSKDLAASIIKKRELDYQRKLEEWAKARSNSAEEKISKPQRPSNLDPKNDLLEGLVKKETIPVGWEIVPLVFVSDNQPNSIVDGPFGSSINVNEDYIDTGVPVIRMVNIRPFRFVQNQMKFIKESKFQSLRRHNILPNDILIAKVGATIGDCCIYPINQPEAMLSTTGSCRIRLDRNVMNIKFLEYHISFHRNTLKDIASQTAQPFLNMKVLKSFPVVLPTIEEQNKIIEEIESRLSAADKMEESITQSLQQGEGLRQSILKKAFEGKLISN